MVADGQPAKSAVLSPASDVITLAGLTTSTLMPSRLADAAGAIQSEVSEIGKRNGLEPLRAWFQALYETLLGQTQGPRMGSFIALYGRAETRALIERALAGEDLSAA